MLNARETKRKEKYIQGYILDNIYMNCKICYKQTDVPGLPCLQCRKELLKFKFSLKKNGKINKQQLKLPL